MAQMKVTIPLPMNLIHMRTDMRDAHNPGSLCSMSIGGCSGCTTLRKRYEKALLDAMQAGDAHEMSVCSGDVEAPKAGTDIFSKLVNGREALRQHVLLNHPEIAGATLVG
jgi:hypothetical protein